MNASHPGIRTALSCALVWLSLVSMDACVRAHSHMPTVLHPKSTSFSGSETSAFLQTFGHCGGGPSGTLSGTWTPSDAEVAEADRRVRTALAQVMSTDPVLRADEFYIQYLGVVINERRMIFINGVHEVAARGSPPEQWRSGPLVICDIGQTGFQTEFDVTAGRVGDIRFAEPYLPTP